MEKTDTQIEREKAAVAAMTNAKSNMDAVLGRVATLEHVLRDASNTIARLKRHVGQDSLMDWHDGSQQQRGLVTTYADKQIAAIATTLSK